VRGHQLLLFADRAEKAERVNAKADQPDHRHRQQRRARAQRQQHPLTRSRR